ncbi:MAG TPA: hypothetical protein VHB25_11280 [Gemmatimonadaceae bacterium]|nr:hypothetical protein [Gemmatimonadaceae bacterium]
MTLRAWLRDRSAPPPARLAARIDAVLGARAEEDATRAAESCLDAAEDLLRDLLARPSAGRDAALDLLTIDALVTYGFEAAAREPAAVEARARAAMQRLAATAAS